MLSNMYYHVFVLSVLLLMSGNVKPNPGPVRFCHLNGRSLLSGVDINLHIASQHSLLEEIYETLVYRSDFEIIAICETWLKDSVPDTDLDLAGYQVPFYRHGGSRGGGVMIYVKEDIIAVQRDDLGLPDIEMLWVELKVK